MTGSTVIDSRAELAAQLVRITLLGPPGVFWIGAPLAIPRRQTRALLFRLAAQAAPVSREQLCYLFWPDEPDATARRSLAHLLTHLRRALPAPDLLIASPDQVGLNSALAWADTTACERLIATAAPRERAGALQQAADMVRGPFLDGFSLPDRPEFDDWAAQERQIWERRTLETLAALIEHHTARGEYSAAINAAQRYLAVDELAEEIHRRLIQLYALSGDRSAALRQFERCSGLLDRELGVGPLPETRAIYEAVRDGRFGDKETRSQGDKEREDERFPLSPGLPVSLSQQLPTAPNPLIGREQELAVITALLRRSDVRLLTLSGPGGAGKTRLGIAAAGMVADERANPPAFVALAAVRDSALIPAAIAQTLGVRESGGQPLLEIVKAVLRERPMLLLLDNFEQVTEAAPLLAELLAAAPGLQLLITSRALLRISGEHVFAVPPLALPPTTNDEQRTANDERPFSSTAHRRTTNDNQLYPADDALSSSVLRPSSFSLEEMAQYGAIALFLARVRATAPNFALTEANAHDIAAICARLDGLPLAIELAAARMMLLSPRMMLARLDRRLALLTDGPRDLPARQQTLRAAIDWSYSLLDLGEQLLFGRLAVFAGGWTLEAAEEICPTAGELSIRVFDGLHALLDKHLVQQQIASDGEPRFAMLETIREYALERLTERGEAPAIQLAHALYFCNLAERAEPELRGPEQVAWLDRLEDEQANLRAALAWCFDDKMTRWQDDKISALSPPHLVILSQIGLRLAGALAVFWKGRSHFSEGRGLLAQALGAVPAPIAAGAAAEHAALAMRAKALAGAGVLAVFQGDRDAAHQQLTESVALLRALEDLHALADTVGYLGMALAFRGEWAASNEALEESEQLARASGNAPALALALYGQARARIERGDDQQARVRMEESLAVARAAGDIGSIALIVTDLGQLILRQGDYTTAQSYSEESLAVALTVKDRGYRAQALNNLGELARCQGDDSKAEACYLESLALFRSQGQHVDTPRVFHNLGYVALHQGDLARARTQFTESLRAFHDQHSRRGVAECLAGLAAVSLADEDGTRAARLWGAAEALREAVGIAMWAADQIEYERQLAMIRAGMDAHTLAAAWATGRALSPEQAVAEALQTTL